MNPEFVLQQDRKQSITRAMAAESVKRAEAYDAAEKSGALMGEIGFGSIRPEVLEAGQYCPEHPTYGLLGVHKSGAVLLCGHKDRAGRQCEVQIPVSTS